MTFSSTLDTVITSINADIATLPGLLEQTQSTTLVIDTSVSYPIPG